MRSARTERLASGLAAHSWRLPVQTIELGAAALDVVLIVSVALLSAIGFHWWAYGSWGEPDLYLGVGALVAALFVPRKWFQGHYRPLELLNLRRQVKRLIPEWLFTFVLLAGIAFALKSGALFSRGATLSFAVTGLFMLMLARVVLQHAIGEALASGLLRGKQAALIGVGDQPLADERISALRDFGYEITTYVALPEGEFGTAEDWREFLSTVNSQTCGSEIEEILINLDWERARSLVAALERLRAVPLPVHVIPDVETARILTKPTRHIGSTVAIEVQRAPLNLAERAFKRSIDICLSATSLFLLFPLLVGVAIVIKLDSAGPVLFRQTRRGFNGRPFTILKFRTMTVLEDGDVVVQASRSDPRITRVGSFLRRSSIDELPQLINVLRGDMSIVGPRPHAVAHDNFYDKLIANYALRHHVKPGLTGWAQVNGYRGETPTLELMAHRVNLDLRYIDTWSLWLDLRIMFRTCIEVFRSPNAY